MNIYILTENIAGGAFLAEHGLSYLIEIDKEKILLDTGHSDVFLKNAQSLGFDLQKEVNTIVLSHGHWDHGDGLEYIQNKILITHPASFLSRFRKKDHSPIGLKLSKLEIENRFRLKEISTSYQITSNLWFLGEIPRSNDFESKETDFEFEDYSPDFVLDDSALVGKINDELVVITGCSHSGICNICEHAKQVTGISKIRAVIGGFHLKQDNLQTQNTIDYFKKNKVRTLLPSHCTALPALSVFYSSFQIKQLKTGMVLDFI